MKHFALTTAFISALIIFSMAQSPQAINYQAVARDTSGNYLIIVPVNLQFTIHDSSSTGTVVYRETDTTTTNELGLFTIAIGNGKADSGTFSKINWATGAKYLQVAIDVNGGNNFVNMGTEQLLSVPFALYALHSGDTTSSSGSSAWLTSGSNVYYNAGNVGIGTANPVAGLQVAGESVAFTATGSIPGSPANVPVSGAGRRLLWYPDRAAFAVGYVNGGEWDTDSIGNYSMAAGYDVSATGIGSVAMGNSNSANGNGSLAAGAGSTAQGNGSVAIGNGAAAFSYGEIALGNFNTLAEANSATSWNDSDRLFTLGNGLGPTSRADAFVVMKSGNTGIGTSTPQYPLDVNGDANVSGDLSVQNGMGIIRNTSDIQLKQQVTNVQVFDTITAGAVRTVAVTWNESFSIAPFVLVGDITSNAVGGTQVVMTITNSTVTGCTLNIYNPKTTTVMPNFYVNIIGIGAE